MQGTDLQLRRVIKASRDKVFAAWTRPELLVQWWGPGPVTCPEAQIDLREGGEYRLANLETDGSITWISGRFELVRAPEELAYTWTDVDPESAPDFSDIDDYNAFDIGTGIAIAF